MRRDILENRTEIAAMSAAVIALGILLLLIGCVPPPTEPDGGTNVNTNVNVNINPGGGSSPAPGTPGTVASVGIGKVSGAETCPVGTAPSGRGDAVKVGCAAFLTCSPKDSTGKELFEGIPQAPESFEVISGAQYVIVGPHGSNAYNLDATGRTATPDGVRVLFQCRVAGITSQPFPLVVVP